MREKKDKVTKRKNLQEILVLLPMWLILNQALLIEITTCNLIKKKKERKLSGENKLLCPFANSLPNLF